MNFYYVTLSLFCAVALSIGGNGNNNPVKPKGDNANIDPRKSEGGNGNIVPVKSNGGNGNILPVKPKGGGATKKQVKLQDNGVKKKPLKLQDTDDGDSRDLNKKNEEIESLLIADTKRDTDDDDSSGLNKKFDEKESLLKAETKHATIVSILNSDPKTKSNSANSGYDSSSSFPLIFMVSFVIIVGGYFLYHKKSKILGFLLEGAPSSARRKAGYKKVRNVEDVMSGVSKHDA